MKVEGWLFAAGFFFFAIAAVIYGILAEEPVGTVALAFTAGLAFLVGYYLLFTARRIDPRPEDSQDRRDRRRRRRARLLQPAQLVAAGRGGLRGRGPFLGVAIGWWLFIIGAGAGVLAVIGLVFEYYRGEPAA